MILKYRLGYATIIKNGVIEIMANVRVYVLISGSVQGIFFRSNTCYHAQELGVNGWVKNRWDGKVEAIFEGEESSVKELIGWCHKGPPGAVVRDVKVEWHRYLDEFDSFSVRY